MQNALSDLTSFGHLSQRERQDFCGRNQRNTLGAPLGGELSAQRTEGANK